MHFARYTEKMHDVRRSEHDVTLLLTNNMHVAIRFMVILCICVFFLFLFSSTNQIQSWVRMSLARKKYLERSKYFKDHVRLSVEQLVLILETICRSWGVGAFKLKCLFTL